MRLTYIIILASVFLVSGCATVKSLQGDVQQLKTRIDSLDSRITDSQQETQATLKRQSDENALLIQKMDEANKKIDSLIEKEQVKEEAKVRMPTAGEIQTALKNAGFFTGEVDGVIGSQTKEAVRKFQEANNLTADGVVGSKTWIMLEKYLQKTEK